MPATLGELATQFGCELIGDPSISVSRVATLLNAQSDSLSFFANAAYRDALSDTSAAAVILKAADAADCPVPALVSDNPYLTYARVAEVLHPSPAFEGAVHASAVIDPSSCVAASAHIAANVVVGRDCTIADGAYVGPGCVIGDRCNIGDNSRLVANVTLVQDVQVGARCILHAGCVLGADGFGIAMSDTGWVKVPQVGGVRVGDDVEVGANSCIDRGAIEDTVIGNGVRMDNLVQIAHNVQVGEHTAMAAMTGISGSAIIGKRCLFGGQGGTVGHITVCDDVMVTGCTMVSKDISEPGVYSGNFHAEKDRSWKRRVARFRRLDVLHERVRELEKANESDDR